MGLLVTGLLLLLVPHSLRELGLRDFVASRLGSRGVYRGAVFVLAVAGLALIVWGKSQAPFVMIWQPPFELRHISNFIMYPVFWLVLAGVLPMSTARWTLRNPMALGVAVWGVAHLWANGDLASMLLFGSFAFWGAIKYLSLFRGTRLPPFRNRMLVWDAIGCTLGSVLYVSVFVFHGDLFGVGLSL